MSKIISIRLTDQMYGYLLETQKMRHELFKKTLKTNEEINESITELIKIAIIRLYNQTEDFWLDEVNPEEQKKEIIYSYKID